jgi:hypothetical protein
MDELVERCDYRGWQFDEATLVLTLYQTRMVLEVRGSATLHHTPAG